MTKKYEETSLTNERVFSQTWQEIWLNVFSQTQKNLMEFWAENPPQPKPQQNMAIFDPEVVADTMSKVMVRLSERPERVMELQKRHLNDVRSVWHNVLARIRGEETTPVIEFDPKDRRFQNPAWQENPQTPLK